MKLKNSKKIIKILISIVFVCYIALVIISSVMLSQITQITYRASAFGTVIREDIIDFKENAAWRNYYDFNKTPVQQKENKIDAEKASEIKFICAVSLFPLWRESYHNPSILDGDQYVIIRTYDNEESATYGSNAYPLTYAFVLSAINSVFE